MQELSIPYGHGKLDLKLPDDCKLDWIEPPYVPSASDPSDVVKYALANPVDGTRIIDFKGSKTAVIAVNDKTRPVPHDILLPLLLEDLHQAGLKSQDIQFVIATGTHLPILANEFDRILPKAIFENYRVTSHDCDRVEELVYKGQTSRGTEVWVNRTYANSDLRIVVGNIEPHHFAGFSGGHKTAAIGLTGRITINHNHAMLVEPGARIAEYSSNPLRQDIEEIGQLIGSNFALNAILNGEKKIVHALSGDPLAVIRSGIPICQQVCQTKIHGSYDLVIASAGGTPKDINFYQSQKALSHASLFTRDGGVIVLVAECPEGTGSRAYEEFMVGLSSPAEVFAKTRTTGFKVGPHKAFQVAREANRVQLVLLSSISPETVAGLLMTPAKSLFEAIQTAFLLLSPTPPAELRIAVLPRATNTIPYTTMMDGH